MKEFHTTAIFILVIWLAATVYIVDRLCKEVDVLKAKVSELEKAK